MLVTIPSLQQQRQEHHLAEIIVILWPQKCRKSVTAGSVPHQSFNLDVFGVKLTNDDILPRGKSFAVKVKDVKVI